jgi:hypothetical protein
LEVKAVVEAADVAYKTSGPDAFMKKLLAGGPMEENQEAIAQANMLRSVQGYYGAYESFEIVKMVDASSTTRFVYAVFNYSKGPLFASSTFFLNPSGWHVVNFRFHTEASQVWPSSLLAK